MSLTKPFDYQDAAAAILDEIELKEISLADVIREIESTCAREALKETRGNISQAARMLGMNRTTLVMRLKKLNVPQSGQEEPRE